MKMALLTLYAIRARAASYEVGWGSIMELQLSQVIVFVGLTALIALVTYLYCKGARHSESGEKEYFLAGGSLKWYFVAGSITLTNLSTDQLVGMNGNQMALVAWWELAAVVGLMMLCFIFIPVF